MKRKEFEFKLRLVTNKQDLESNRQLIKLIPKKNRWDYLDCVTRGYGMQNAYRALPKLLELANQLDLPPSEVLEVYSQFKMLGEVLNSHPVKKISSSINGSNETKSKSLVSRTLINN